MWFRTCKDGNTRVLRWRLKLAEYVYDVVYKTGKTNVNADALSRNPIKCENNGSKEEIFTTNVRGRTEWTKEEAWKFLEDNDNEEDGMSDEEITEEEKGPEQLWKDSLRLIESKNNNEIYSSSETSGSEHHIYHVNESAAENRGDKGSLRKKIFINKGEKQKQPERGAKS